MRRILQYTSRSYEWRNQLSGRYRKPLSSFATRWHSTTNKNGENDNTDKPNVETTQTISIDRSNLVNPSYMFNEGGEADTTEKEETPLVDVIRKLIATHGPMSIKEFMQICLTHPIYGYYITRNVFGEKGDFTTSPEISQMFGEMLGIWCVASYETLGRPEKIRIVELGPGRGTLMKDMVRSFKPFKDFQQALSKGGITFVEASPQLMELQKSALECKTTESDETVHAFDSGVNVNVSWNGLFANVVEKSDEVLIVIAQEFLDALPVEQYEFTERGWCERLVDLADPNQPKLENNQFLPDLPFRFILDPLPTPTQSVPQQTTDNIEIGENVEIGMAAMAVTEEIANAIKSRGGSALIIDYGDVDFVRNSLRGIKDHKFVHPLQDAGLVDLSVDVDFASLKRTVEDVIDESNKQNEFSIGGPLDQGEFLLRMGIQTRAKMLYDAAANEEEGEKIVKGFSRLVEPEIGNMGSVYKAMALMCTPPLQTDSKQSLEIPGFN